MMPRRGRQTTLEPRYPARTAKSDPFLIASYSAAVSVAIAVVGSELLILAWLRHKFFHTSFARSFLAVTVGGAIIASLSAALGLAAGG